MLCYAFTSIGKRSASSCLFSDTAKKVSPIGKTPSAATGPEVSHACIKMKVYQHWLAALLNKAFNDYDSTKLNYTINNVIIPYNSVEINTFVDKYRRVVQRRIDNPHEHELSLTAVLAELIKEVLGLTLLTDNISCSHQCVFHGHGEKGDIMITERDELFNIIRVFLIGDMKPNELSHSKIESVAYASRTALIGNYFGVQLVLSYTCHGVSLSLAQSANNKLLLYDLCTAEVPIVSDMCRFFFATIIEVKYLIKDTDIYEQSRPYFNPLPNIYVDEDSILSSRYRTFRHGDLVYKRFIPEEYKQTGERSNIDVIKSLGQKLGTGNYFEELEIINFCGFEYLKYKYILCQAFIVPTSSAQIIEFVSILAALHEIGYVHSDITSF